jgi:hypothetical protein
MTFDEAMEDPARVGLPETCGLSNSPAELARPELHALATSVERDCAGEPSPLHLASCVNQRLALRTRRRLENSSVHGQKDESAVAVHVSLTKCWKVPVLLPTSSRLPVVA